MRFMLWFGAAADAPAGGREAVGALGAALRAHRGDGVVEALFVLAGGGLVFVVHADSRADLVAALRNSAILHAAAPDIEELDSD